MRALGWLTLIGCVAACGTETGTLTVIVKTDFVAGDDFVRVRVTLYDAPPEEGGNLSDQPVEVDVTSDVDLTEGRRVTRFEPLLAGRWAARAELITASGRVLAARTVATEVHGDSEVVIAIDEQDLIGGGLPCAVGVDPSTVALYTFDDDAGGTSITDETGAHHGTLVGATAQAVDGPDGCGAALVLPDDGEVYVEVPDADDFHLASGSLELWVRPHVTPDASTQGIVSRDAGGTARAGHFTLMFTPDRRIVARLQNPDGEAHRCSNDPVELDRWAHVGVSFGPEGFELWVDGTMSTFTGEIVVDPDPTSGSTISCGGGTVRGIEGNDNPWVLGASAWSSDEGAATPASGFFRGGAIDHLRIASDRREFGRAP